MTVLTFLKLGGSLITDKAKSETARYDVIARLSTEIAAALAARPDLRLVVGHGSGSFGHAVAAKYQTQKGVRSAKAWRGFAKVAVAAARLNRIVLDALDAAGVPVWSIQPSASAVCHDGVIVRMALGPIQRALEEGLVPLVYGDVALDLQRGGTIISTEDIFSHLALMLSPQRILLAGREEGVWDREGRIVPHLTPSTLESVRDVLRGSAQTDVTGGMEAKVMAMLALCEDIPGLTVRIFSGEVPGAVEQALTDDQFTAGTLLTGG